MGWLGFLRDRPIPGGIEAYRAADREGRMFANCACGHTGYYVLRDDIILWYVTVHDSIDPKGEVIAETAGQITFRRRRRPWHDGDTVLTGTMEKTEFGLRVVQGEKAYRLKRTYLGPEIREMVEAFDYGAWLEENARE